MFKGEIEKPCSISVLKKYSNLVWRDLQSINIANSQIIETLTQAEKEDRCDSYIAFKKINKNACVN